MKVRWTNTSLRLRITPAELELLRGRQPVIAAMSVGPWEVLLEAGPEESQLLTRGAQVRVRLSSTDLAALLEPTAEGVYMVQGDFKYYVEKDFPCEHPRPNELALAPALEVAQTFPRPE
jgi:hypothetical protein